MTSGRKERMLKGIASDSVSQMSQMFIRLAEVPLLLHFWGVNLYGEWLIITALPSYLAISDFGLTHVTARQVVMQMAKGDKKGALATFQSSAVLVAVTSFTISLLFFLMIWLLPVKDIFHLDRIFHDEVLVVTALFGIKIIVYMQGGIFGSALQATGHYPLFFLLTAGISLVEFLLLALTVAMGGGPVLTAGVMLSTVVAGMLLLYLVVRRYAPWFQLGLGSFRFEIVRNLAKPALAALSFPASNALNYQGTRLIIGSVLGPVAVVLFVPHRQLAGFVSRTNIIGKSINVELGLAYGENDMASFRRLTLQSMQLLAWSAMAAAIAIGVVAWLVFPLWTGGKLQFDAMLFSILLITVIFEVVWRAAFQPASSTNQHISLAKVVLVVNIGILLLMYVLSSLGGLLGASLALFGGVFILLAYSIRNASNITNIAINDLVINIMHPPKFILSDFFHK